MASAVATHAGAGATHVAVCDATTGGVHPHDGAAAVHRQHCAPLPRTATDVRAVRCRGHAAVRRGIDWAWAARLKGGCNPLP